MTKVFDFETVAFVGQTWGVEGGLKFKGIDEVFTLLLELGYLFIQHEDGSPVPYSIMSAEQKGDFVLFLAGIDLPEDAKSLSGRPILLPVENVSDGLLALIKQGGVEKHPWVNWYIVDARTAKEYRILSVEQYPHQEMAVVEGEVLIPLHDRLIEEIDQNNKLLKMDLPEGLFEK